LDCITHGTRTPRRNETTGNEDSFTKKAPALKPGQSVFHPNKLPASAAVAAASTAATTTTAAVTAAVSTATATTAACAIGLGLGFVDLKRAPVDFLTIKLLDGLFALGFRRHLDESKAAGAAGFAVFDYVGRLNRSYGAKQIIKVLVRCIEGQISYVKFH
jgi:hypothetical protein